MPDYGVVAECNPFHNAHKYLIDTLKSRGDSTVTVALSESFVQRGECASAPVSVRTRALLSGGADLVLSLPVGFAVSGAEHFAEGGVGVLTATGVIDTIAFGSESANAVTIRRTAELLLSEETDSAVLAELKSGISYPKARENAIRRLYGDAYADILKNPNDILGVEYCKALIKSGSSASVLAIGRVGAFHDVSSSDGTFRCASEIRAMMSEGLPYEEFVPENCREIYREAFMNGKMPADYKKLGTAVLAVLRRMTPSEFRALPEVSEGLENVLYRAARSALTLEDFYSFSKSKRYTHARIRRIALYAFLGITAETAAAPLPYIRVLGMNKSGERLLKDMKKKASLPIAARPSDFKNLSEEAKSLFDLECKSRDLFSLALPVPSPCGEEMTDKIIRI